MRDRCPGGGPRERASWLRVAYFDEAGVSKASHEPFLVVAGVITDPDTHYRALETHIRALSVGALGKKATPYYGKPYVFHAKDIWHGSGDFVRTEWSRSARMELLESLCRIPSDFGLPIIFGQVAKKQRSQELSVLHNEAYLLAVKRLESWMRANAKDEVVAIISERCDKAHMARIAAFHHLVTDKSMADRPRAADQFVSDHIIEAPIFLDKYSSPLLQIADVCAFVLKRKAQRCRHVEPYFALMQKALWYRPEKGNRVLVRAPLHDLRDAKTGKPYSPETSNDPSRRGK